MDKAAAPPSAGGTRQRFRLDDVRRTYKRRDAWWTVFLVDPLASRLVLPIANRTNITPNQVSFASFVVGLLAAAAFVQGDHPMLVAGALLYHLSFVLDCVDGKVARLKGTGSVFGMWLDYSFDRYRVLVCTVALTYGQYERTGEVLFIWLAVLVTFLDMLRYMDALQVYKLRREMDRRLRTAARTVQRRKRSLGASYIVAAEAPARYVGVGGSDDGGYRPVPPVMDRDPAMYAPARPRTGDLQQEFRQRFGWWADVRDAVMRLRVRPHLFSGIEYQMFIFVLGPLFDAVVPFVLFSAVMLLVFEVAVIYKLLLSSRDFERQMRRQTPSTASAAVTATATAAGAPEVAQSTAARPEPAPAPTTADEVTAAR